MMKHSDLWRAVDRLAEQNGLSPSGLAKRAGLDPTTFNPSKRTTSQGKSRWPSTESVAKILEVTDTDPEQFFSLLREGNGGTRRRIPIIGCAQAGRDGFFDEAGFPAGDGWDEVLFPDIADPQAYALEIQGDSMEPIYREGDTIIVSPSSDIRRGDRVVIRTADGEVMAKQLGRRTADRMELDSLNPAHDRVDLPIEDITWIARIIWASQ